MPFRMIADWMTRHGIPLSTGTAHNIMRRLGMSLGAPAAAIAAMIRKARILHADETSIHLNGRNVWVWILHDPLTGHALYVIQDSRGAKVPERSAGRLGRRNSERRLDGVREIPRPALLVLT